MRDVTAALELLPDVRYPLPKYDLLIAHLDEVLARAHVLSRTAPTIPLSEVKLLSPVANPGKLIAAPVNYQKHLDEVRGNSALHHNTVGHTVTI